MKQNKYDYDAFFAAYKEMPRSQKGLEGAGEWPLLKKMLPPFAGKSVLDLGCGFGWHCRYAREEGAEKIIGVDLSEKMLHEARKMTSDAAITYTRAAIEEIDFPKCSFDIVVSSLAFHYVQSFNAVCKKVNDALKPGGTFVFSVEHPIFTSRAEQDWNYDDAGNKLHFPIDRYKEEGVRNTSFLADDVIKYHRTLSTYMQNLLTNGFQITEVEESGAPAHMSQWKDENRRPMFLLLSAVKK
ncbi:class I SAM-dependent methyltransferase [Bacillus sp. JCM 19041]|uniref:class I SAM-dependent methyltransferase n=1 Tax=Bacillus sp. JCM 19041 TaxID=1460637 RepID=UPI0006D00DF7